MIAKRYPSFFVCMLLCLNPAPVFAACTAPNGVAGTMDYFTSENDFRFCNGTDWVSMSGNTSGSVVAFDMTHCPPGWSEYLPARGRFVRGIDNGAGNDPDGTRAPGNAQADEFKSHTHPSATPGPGGGPMREAIGGSIESTIDYNDGFGEVPTGPRGGAETRPKNVALLYCRKN